MEERQLKEMLAYEAFLRRAAALDMPFMLKGSYVTRQYYAHPEDRIPADLDWVYLDPLSEAEDAEQKFDAWAIAVTEAPADDTVIYTSFMENRFWRMIDYAMADDFPTVSTHLSCVVDEELLEYLGLDVSFNLDIDVPPVPLLYHPLRGKPFTIPFAAPLSLQVSWKMHQTLVRPRFKDMLDLIHLLKHPSWNREMLLQSAQALVNECAADNVNIDGLAQLIRGEIASLVPDGNRSLEKTWQYWRHDGYSDSRATMLFVELASSITDVSKLPQTLPEFLKLLAVAFEQSGWNKQLLQQLPKPQRGGQAASEPDKQKDTRGSVAEEPHHDSHSKEEYYLETSSAKPSSDVPEDPYYQEVSGEQSSPEIENPSSDASERSTGRLAFRRFWQRLFKK